MQQSGVVSEASHGKIQHSFQYSHFRLECCYRLLFSYAILSLSLILVSPRFELIADRRSMHLVVVQKRSSLLVSRNNVLLPSEANLLAEDTWDSNDQGSDEENAHDDECEDPLECNGSGEELSDAESCG